MKILQVISSFPPAYEFGGPLQTAYDLSVRLGQLGHDVWVYTTDLGGDYRRLLSDQRRSAVEGIHVVRFRNLSIGLVLSRNLAIAPGVVLGFARHLAEFDIVHVHEFRSFQATFAQILANVQNVPVIVQPHGGAVSALTMRRLKRVHDALIGKWLLRAAARAVALNSDERGVMMSLGTPASRIALLPNGVRAPTDEVYASRGRFRSKNGIDARSFTILYLGRITEPKGVRILYEAYRDFCSMRAGRGNATLVLCGPSSDLLREIKAAAGADGVRVVAPGVVTGLEKAAVFLDSDVFCLPSLHETQSVALLEAASYGLPILAGTSNVPGEFLEAQAGLFVKLNSRDLSVALTELADSPEARRTLGVLASRVVKQFFSFDLMVQRFLTLYSNVLDERRTGRPARAGGRAADTTANHTPLDRENR